MKRHYTLALMIIGWCVMFTAKAMSLSSPDFIEGGKMPAALTCDGDNISPALTWSGAPEATKSYVLIMSDPDATSGTWVHWVVYNIPAILNSFAQGKQQGIGVVNTWGKPYYGGPCPPSGAHRYVFTLYALNTALVLPTPVTVERLTQAMKPHVLAEAKLIGLYR